MRTALTITALALSLAACGGGGDDGGGGPRELTAAEKTAVLAALPAPYNAANLANGEKQFAACRSCHTIAEGGPDLVGPNLHGVFARRIGSKPGYAYSEAVKKADFTWDGAHLEQWLSDPRGFLPGTKMTFPGLKDAQDRHDLIAYVMVESGYRP